MYGWYADADPKNTLLFQVKSKLNKTQYSTFSTLPISHMLSCFVSCAYFKNPDEIDLKTNE